MQILFVHPNFPAQFGPLLSRLTKRADVESVFLSLNASGVRDGIRCIPFRLRGRATQDSHYCSRTFENGVWHAHAVYETCKAAKLEPDLIVGHSGFETTALLRDLYTCPIVNYFEYYYHGRGTDGFPARYAVSGNGRAACTGEIPMPGENGPSPLLMDSAFYVLPRSAGLSNGTSDIVRPH